MSSQNNRDSDILNSTPSMQGGEANMVLNFVDNTVNKYRLTLLSDVELLRNASIVYQKGDVTSKNHSLESGYFGQAKHGRCTICKQGLECPGHFGVIPLDYPVITNSIVETDFKKLIQMICPICSHFPIADARESLKLRPNERFVWMQKRIAKLQTQSVNMCPYCKNKFKFISINKLYSECPYIRYYAYLDATKESVQINPLIIYAMLNNFTDIEYIGFPTTYHPKNFMTKYIVIIPNKLRQKTSDTGSSVITSQYRNIIEKILPELNSLFKLSIGENKIIENNEIGKQFNTIYSKLNAYVRLYIDMTKESTTNRCLAAMDKTDKRHIDQSFSLVGKIKGKKTSLFEKGIDGTRHGNSARTVLGGATDIHCYQLGFPAKYANKMGCYVSVYEENLELIKQMVAKMSDIDKHDPTLPKIAHLWKVSNNERKIIKPNRALQIAAEIRPGDKVYMSLLPGSPVMFCRFPAVREESWTTFELAPTNHPIMTLPLAACEGKTADFDGDETNMYAMYSHTTDAETILLHSPYRTCVQYKKGTMLIYYKCDTEFEVARLKADMKLGVEEIYDATGSVISRKSFYPPRLVLDIISDGFEDVTGHGKIDIPKIDKINYESEDLVVVNNRISKEKFSLNDQPFFLYLYMTIGGERTLMLMDKIIQTGYNTANYIPISFGNEIRIYKDHDKIMKLHEDAYKVMCKYEQVNDPQAIKDFKQKANSEMYMNEIITMLLEGGEGTNLEKLGFLVKYQKEYYSACICMDHVTVDEKRIQSTLADNSRTCCAFPKYSNDPCAYGYIKHGYMNYNITPIETFYDCMIQRKALYNKGSSVDKQGYLAKKFVMSYGPNVVDANGAVCYDDTLISFAYGSGSLNPRLSILQPLVDIDLSEKEFKSKYSENKELFELFKEITEGRNIYARLTTQTKLNLLKKHFAAGFDFEQYFNQFPKGVTSKKDVDEFIEQLKNVFAPKGMIQRYALKNFNMMEYYFRIKLLEKKLTRDQLVKLYHKYNETLVAAGESVGFKAALSVSEAFTQAILHSIHHASGGSTSVDRLKQTAGIDRFTELLGGNTHKHPIITLGFYEPTKAVADKFAKEQETIYFSDIWTKLETYVGGGVNPVLKKLHPKINFDHLNMSSTYVKMIWNISMIADYDIKFSEIFNTIMSKYPDILFISGYILNAKEFAAFIHFQPNTRQNDIDGYIQQWKSRKDINIIHGKYLVNCLVTLNKNTKEWIVKANEVNPGPKNTAYEKIIFDERIDPGKCKTTNTSINIGIYGIFESSARLCEETIYCSGNLSATSDILPRHYKTICMGATATARYFLATANSASKVKGDYLRRIAFEKPVSFIRDALLRGEYIPITDAVSAQTFSELPRFGSGYSDITIFKA